MDERDEKQLMERCKNGDRQAFEVLLARYEKPVYNAAYRMLHSREDARDVTQTVFLKAFENLSQFDPDRRFFSWIYRIALNESINWLNKSNRLTQMDREALDETDGPEDAAGNEQLRDDMQAALMTLSSDYRAAIVLKHVLELSYREISDVLEVPEKTVKSRLYTARQLLRDELTGRGIH